MSTHNVRFHGEKEKISKSFGFNSSLSGTMRRCDISHSEKMHICIFHHV